MGTFDAMAVAADIVAAFVSNNSLPTAELPMLIELVHSALKGFGRLDEVGAAIVDPPSPAVSIRKFDHTGTI